MAQSEIAMRALTSAFSLTVSDGGNKDCYFIQVIQNDIAEIVSDPIILSDEKNVFIENPP